MATNDCKALPSTTKDKLPYTRNITVLETVSEAAVKSKAVGVNYVPINLEPCIVLRGKWLKEAGFDIRHKLTITVEHNQLRLAPQNNEA